MTTTKYHFTPVEIWGLKVKFNELSESNIVANLEAIRRKANIAFDKGEKLTFPPIEAIIGFPPCLPKNRNITQTMEVSRQLFMYYSLAYQIEREFLELDLKIKGKISKKPVSSIFSKIIPM